MSSYLAPGNIQYNYAQLEGIWTQAGGPAGAAPIAAAIAMAESGGNTTATDQDSNGSVDRGLWQINSVHGAQSTYDVMGNARAAVAISNGGQNWSPWTTYTNGAYRQYLQTNVPPDTTAPINATQAAANTGSGGVTAVDVGAFGIPGLPSWFDPSNWFSSIGGDIGSALQGAIISIFNPIIQILAGVLGITAGGIMVLIGLYMIVSNTEAGQKTKQTVGKGVQAGMMAFGPEATAATQYIGAEGKATTVTQTRRPAGRAKIGGQSFQFRPAQVTTTVDKSTQQQLRDEAGSFNQKNGSKK